MNDNAMTLLQKLNTISIPKLSNLQDGSAMTIEEFWHTFIEKRLPDKAVVLQWHRTLMEYVHRSDAVFAIRGYNTASKENYNSLRRGFLTKSNEGYSFFYTDNFHAAYYFKMVMDGYIATSDEINKAYNDRAFPSRFGRDTFDERALMAMHNGVDPGIQTSGYKIAHIINVGKDYYINGENVSLSRIIQRYYPGGNRSDWVSQTDPTGTYYLRNLVVSPEAKQYLIAEFFRFVHPFNYFLTPKKSCASSPVCSDIAEFQPLVYYVQRRYAEIYGKAYEEFLNMIMVDRSTFSNLSGKVVINLRYGPSLLRSQPSVRNSPVSQQTERTLLLDNSGRSPTSMNGNTPVTKTLELQIVKEYLVNPKTSFRQLERQYMGIDSQARGGGFEAKRIVNSYGVIAEQKGVLHNQSIDYAIEHATGQYKKTLVLIKQCQ